MYIIYLRKKYYSKKLNWNNSSYKIRHKAMNHNKYIQQMYIFALLTL